MDTSSDRYSGAMSLIDINKIFNWISCLTGSQLSVPLYTYISMYGYMYGWMYGWMYVCMYRWMYGWMCVWGIYNSADKSN